MNKCIGKDCPNDARSFSNYCDTCRRSLFEQEKSEQTAVEIKDYPVSESAITRVGSFIFEIRWGLMPMYVGLWVAMMLYIVKFFQGVYELGTHFWALNENDMLVSVLGLIDITMIGNLIVMTTVGGYSIFVKEYDTKNISDKPRWLNNINSSTLKIKMGMSIIGVGAIHLLKTFFDVNSINWDDLSKLGFIFTLFILFTYMLCVIDAKLHSLHPSTKAADEQH